MRQSIQALHKLIFEWTQVTLSPGDWAPTPNRNLGDFSIPCFKLSKSLGKAPPQIAQDLAQKFNAAIASGDPQLSIFERIDPVGPYLNVFQKPLLLGQKLLSELQQSQKPFGSSDLGKGQNVVIDFSSPNVAKEIGLHHLRSTAIGHSLAQIFRHFSYNVHGINYLGDWGTSFGKLILGLQKFGKEEDLKNKGLSYMLDLYVKFNQAEKDDPSLSDQAKAAFGKLEKGDPEYRRIWKLFRDISIEQFQLVYRRLGIHFDHFDGESLYESKLEKAIQEVSDKIGTKISDGALICELPGHKIPVLLKKDDGASLYITRDLAAIQDRHERFHFDLALYVVAIQQKLHFTQLFDLVKNLDKPYAGKAEHISFGMLSFGSKTMKSREGNAIFLKDALDEGKARALEIIREKNPSLENIEEVAEMIGCGALIFNDLSQNRTHDIDFQWEKALSFEGDTGPFLQYTHARCTSLLEKAKKHLDLIRPQSVSSDLEALARHESVRNLLLEWDSYPLFCEKALLNRDPSQIATSLLNIAQAFNHLYHHIHLLQETSAERLEFLIDLSAGTQKILKEGLGLLGIRAPQKM